MRPRLPCCVVFHDIREEALWTAPKSSTRSPRSLERLQLVTAIEDEFDLEIDDETLLSLNSVADAVDAIENAKEA